MIEKLRSLNHLLNMKDIHDPSFKKFGKVLDDFPVLEIREQMSNIEIPNEGNVYVASEKTLVDNELKSLLEKKYYGGMRIQIGYCNGNNSNLNGLEFHKGSEINVAITDLVLLLGHINDICDGVFSVTDVQGYYVPAGTAIELYQTTLHLSPCKVSDKGFKCAVILPEGTNTEIKEEEKELDRWLFKKNKWLLAHPESKHFIDAGAYIGIKGENLTVHYPTQVK